MRAQHNNKRCAFVFPNIFGHRNMTGTKDMPAKINRRIAAVNVARGNEDGDVNQNFAWKKVYEERAV